MAGDDLNEPLGMTPSSPGGSRWWKAGLWGTSACLALGVIGTAAYLVVKNPRAGEPVAVATIAPPAKPVPQVVSPEPPKAVQPQPPAQEARTIENGVTVVRAAGGSEPGRHSPMVIKVPEALGLSEVAATDPRLLEPTRYGPLPRIGVDGTRPADFYSRPLVFSAASRPGAPRIAIYIGGLGLDPASTREAITAMPPAVSLAFAPYASHLDDLAKQAKVAGHEIFLQIPMETFGDRNDQPGPHTLLADAPKSAMVDDLHWLMSRMTGYAGVANFLGAKFTADRAAMSAMLQETASRGLLYLDDGGSKRSLGPAIAPQLGVTSARADIVLDADPDPAAVRTALVKLEAMAREKGSAVGMANGRAGDFATIAAFAATLANKGITLVPVSAVASLNPSSLAATP